MALSLRSRAASSAVSRLSRPRVNRVAVVTVRAEGEQKADGFIQKDNSGLGNIFPTTAKPFVSSPTTDAVASEGLGGIGGGLVLLAAIGVVGLATVTVVGQQTGETLQTISTAYDGDSLSAIAARIAASL